MRRALVCLLAVLPVAFAAEPGPPPREVRVDRYGDPLPEGAIMRLGTTRGRHIGAYNIACSDDGKRIVTIGTDHFIRVWDAESGRELSSHAYEGDEWTTAAVSRNGELAAYCTEKGLAIHSVSERKVIQTLSYGESNPFAAVGFSANQKFLVTADNTPREHRIRVWDLRTGKKWVVGVVETPAKQVAISEDGSRVYIVADSGDALKGSVCTCWDSRELSSLWSVDNVAGIRLAEQGKRVMFQARDHTKNFEAIGRWHVADAATGRKLGNKDWPCPSDDRASSISPDGSMAAIVADRRLTIRDAVSSEVKQRFAVIPEATCFAPDGQSIFVVDEVWRVQRYRLKDGKAAFDRATDASPQMRVGHLAWSPDGNKIASLADDESDGLVWDLKTTRPAKRLPTAARSTPIGLEFTDNRRLVTATNYAVQTWDLATRRQVLQWKLPEKTLDGDSVDHERIQKFKSLGSGERVRIVSDGEGRTHTACRVFTVDGRTGEVVTQRPVPNGRYTAIGGHHVANLYSCCSVRPDGPISTLDSSTQPADRYHPLSFSGDDALLLEAHSFWNSYAPHRLFERVTGREVCVLPARDEVFRLAFAPNGLFVAIASEDGISIVDIASRSEALRIPPPKEFISSVHSLSWSSDGRRIATGHGDTTILIWDVSTVLPKPAGPLDEKDLAGAWDDLAAPSATKGMGAVWKLRLRREQAVPLIRERLLGAKQPTSEQLRALIASLEDKSYRARESAERQIIAIGDRARRDLELARSASDSQEQKLRIDRILAALDIDKPPLGDDLRAIRCVNVLENLADKESRAMLKELARGPGAMRVTWEAREALERMGEPK